MSILNALPGISPSVRTFGMDRWVKGSVKMRNGSTATWPLTNSPAGASMELVWENITHSQAELLASTWDANYGIHGRLELNADNLAGMDAGLSDLVKQPAQKTSWGFAGPPVIESVKNGRCTVRASLINKRPIAVGFLTPGLLLSTTLPLQFGFQLSSGQAVTTIIDKGLITLGLTPSILLPAPFFIIGASGSALVALPPEGTLEWRNEVESLDLSIPPFGVNTLLPPEGTLDFENLTESLELSVSSIEML